MNDGYDVVSGWRRDRQDAAIRRNFVSRVANRLSHPVSGVHLHDYGCTLKAYRSGRRQRSAPLRRNAPVCSNLRKLDGRQDYGDSCRASSTEIRHIQLWALSAPLSGPGSDRGHVPAPLLYETHIHFWRLRSVVVRVSGISFA